MSPWLQQTTRQPILAVTQFPLATASHRTLSPARTDASATVIGIWWRQPRYGTYLAFSSPGIIRSNHLAPPRGTFFARHTDVELAFGMSSNLQVLQVDEAMSIQYSSRTSTFCTIAGHQSDILLPSTSHDEPLRSSTSLNLMPSHSTVLTHLHKSSGRHALARCCSSRSRTSSSLSLPADHRTFVL